MDKIPLPAILLGRRPHQTESGTKTPKKHSRHKFFDFFMGFFVLVPFAFFITLFVCFVIGFFVKGLLARGILAEPALEICDLSQDKMKNLSRLNLSRWL